MTTTFQAIGQDRFKNLDRYLQELENDDSFSGIVVIVKNGETLFSKTVGFADRENRVKMRLWDMQEIREDIIAIFFILRKTEL